MVTVYIKPACVQCDATKRLMDKLGVEYDTVDITSSPEDMAKVISLGFKSAPVVIAGDQSWSGFNPDRIYDLAS